MSTSQPVLLYKIKPVVRPAESGTQGTTRATRRPFGLSEGPSLRTSALLRRCCRTGGSRTLRLRTAPIRAVTRPEEDVGSVLHSRDTRRIFGNPAVPRATPGCPNASSLSGVSATSNVLPSMDASRRSQYHALRVSGAATGSTPNRARAREIGDFCTVRIDLTGTPSQSNPYEQALEAPHRRAPCRAPARSRSRARRASAASVAARSAAPSPQADAGSPPPGSSGL